MVLSALWLVPVADLGGVARHVLDATRSGVPGARIVVLCPEGPLAEALRAQGRAVLTGPVSPQDGAPRAVRTVRRVLERLGPDLLHTHLAFADLTGVAAVAGLRSARGRRIRVLSTEHGISGVPGAFRSSAISAHGRDLAHRARLQRTDHVIAVSASTRQQVLQRWGGAAPITVVRNAVDAPLGATAPRPGLRVLSLSRLAPEKRLDRVLDAFAHLLALAPEATLTLGGDGPQQGALRRLVQRSGLADRVRMPGHLEASGAIAGHDVVVQLSDWENLSYTLLDAVAAGLGVVATDVGGNREILPPECLVDGDDVEAVARLIALQGSQLRRRPAPRAAGVRSMTEGIGTVYEGVMA